MHTRTTYTIVLILVAALALGIVGLIGWTVFRAVFADPPQYRFEVTTAPEEVRLYINDNEPIAHTSPATYTVESETVTLRAEHEHFDPYQQEIRLNEDQTTEVVIVMDLNDPAGEDALLTDEYFQGQDEATQQYWDQLESLSEIPLYEALPEEQDTFQAYYGVSGQGNDMAVHLVLYTDDPEAGRADFRAWMDSIGEDPDDYEIIEHLEDPPLAGEDTPSSMEELAALSPTHPADYDVPSPDQLTPDELVTEFLTIAHLHAPGEDVSLYAAIARAEALLVDELTGFEEPDSPMNTPIWWDAHVDDALSYPWIVELEPTDPDADSQSRSPMEYQATVCWAWFPADGSTPYLDNPRHWTVEVSPQPDDTWLVSQYSFEAEYELNDPQDSVCALD